MIKLIISIVPVVLLLYFSEYALAQKADKEKQSIQLTVEFGHTSKLQSVQAVKLIGGSQGLLVSEPEYNRVKKEKIYINRITVDATWPKPSAAPRNLPHTHMWKYLLENGSPGQVERLLNDPWDQPDAPILTILLNEEGTRGFSIGLEQLLSHGAMWLPEHDAFITIADKPADFKKHLESLTGQRTLERIKNEPEASLDQFKGLWTDFGNPLITDTSWERWQSNWMGTKGHLTITAAGHGSIYKYAIDRWGNVRPDFASPHKFRMDINWEESQWKEQKIMNGLPIISTSFERNGQFGEIEQFAGPVGEIDAAVRGYIPSVLYTRVKISGEAGPFNFGVNFKDEEKHRNLELTKINDNNWMVTDKNSDCILLKLDAKNELSVEVDNVKSTEGGQIYLRFTGELHKGETKEFFIKILSPSMLPSQTAKLQTLDFFTEKGKVIKYWEDWIARGAHFNVPEDEVNHLFKANLWHALILPRHTIGIDNKPHMDLPYANTAYGQQNADWPINQAVYVDYMIYGLRGYEKTAVDELLAMFKTQQQPDGKIGGFANWGVYSPGLLYTIAQNYLLSRDNEQFERLLPNSMKLLDWCLIEIAKSNIGTDKTGLIIAPLNDLTISEQEWAFTQAYFYGGVKLFSEALAVYNHSRAEEVFNVALKFKQNIEHAFARSSVKSPVVQLADGTWINYVPADAMTPRRLLDQWYPTDVDTGPLHLSRLGALNAHSWLTTAMLHDHEDNLFLNNLGAANEPVYIQQANAYLLRDEPEAVIRSFYSMMACAFSHNQLTALEHRWAHGIYYSPPSTDGAWFEIYRKMLLNEFGTDTLFIGQAIPRVWLADGKKVEVKNAPTYFGPVSFTIDSQVSKDEIITKIELSERNLPKELLIRLRNPDSKPIRSIFLNGKNWKNYDADKEYIIISNPADLEYTITTKY